MTSGQGGQDPQQGSQPPQDQSGWQNPQQGWPNPQQGWQGQPPQGWQHPQQGWQGQPPQGWPNPQQGWGQPPYGYPGAPAGPGQYQLPAEAPERPTTVRVGVGAFLATLILGVIGSFVQLGDLDALVSRQLASAGDPAVTEEFVRVGLIIGVVIALLLLAVQGLFIWFAWQGRNWARIVLWVLGGLSVLFGLAGVGMGTSGSGFLDALSVISLLLTVVGIVALALKPSSAWYQAMTERRRAGLR